MNPNIPELLGYAKGLDTLFFQFRREVLANRGAFSTERFRSLSISLEKVSQEFENMKTTIVAQAAREST